MKVGNRFRIFFLTIEESLRQVMRADTASLQKIVAVLEKKTESRWSQKVVTLFAATDDTVLR